MLTRNKLLLEYGTVDPMVGRIIDHQISGLVQDSRIRIIGDKITRPATSKVQLGYMPNVE